MRPKKKEPRRWNSFLFYAMRWLCSDAVRQMDPEQRGWYIQLLAECWNGSPQPSLPNHYESLLFLAGVKGDPKDDPIWSRRWAFVVQQFERRGDRLIHYELSEQRKKHIAVIKAKGNAGRLSGEKRRNKAVEKPLPIEEVKPKVTNICSTDVQQNLTGVEHVVVDVDVVVDVEQDRKGSAEGKRLSDDEWLAGLETSPAYIGIDVHREHARMVVWCQAHGKQPTRRRFVNWLNKVDRPMTNGAVAGQPSLSERTTQAIMKRAQQLPGASE